MAITTAAELKSAVMTWLARTDLSDYGDDFITLAEAHLNRELRHRKMVTTADLTPASNVCTLPADYLYYVRVVEKVSPRRELKYITPNSADQLYPSQAAGLACDFTIIGSELTAYPLSSNDIELTYFQKLSTLASNDSNWLLADVPGLYLSACRMMALDFINETDSPRFQTVARMTRQLIDSMNSESDMAQYAKAGVRLGMTTP